jgi:hypothetical protein
VTGYRFAFCTGEELCSHASDTVVWFIHVVELNKTSRGGRIAHFRLVAVRTVFGLNSNFC